MKILDRYLSGQILGTVTWAVSLLTMILVLGNVLRDLLSLLLSHQVPVTYILTFIAYLLPFSIDLLDSLGSTRSGSPRIRQALFRQ